MNDKVPVIVTTIGIAAAVVIACLFVGSCVRDYSSATPRVVDVLVTDKQHVPGHTTTDCDTDSNGHMSCSTTYHPPTWSVEYADETRHWLHVSQGTHDALRIGDKKVLRYDLGGGYWHARYNERFEFGLLVAEGSWPAK